MTMKLLPTGKGLTEWICAGGVPDRGGQAILWRYRWQAAWGERLFDFQDRLCPDNFSESSQGDGVIFVLGLWRTGTTLLHELLASGPGVSTPQTWQCMNPATFPFTGKRRTGRSLKRPMDTLEVDPSSPQEDEFALLAQGAPSVYRAWIDPRRWRDTLQALEQSTWLTLPTEQWFTRWCRFLSECVSESGHTLVIKSPNHTFRLQAIARLWPRARYVWIVRDSQATWHSNVKMWNAMMDVYSLWNWKPSDVECLLEEAFNRYLHAIRWAITHLPGVYFIKFDDLVLDTASCLEGVVDRFRLGEWSAWRNRAATRIEKSGAHEASVYPSCGHLSTEVGRLLSEIDLEHRKALVGQPSAYNLRV